MRWHKRDVLFQKQVCGQMRHLSEVGAAEDEAFLTNLAVNRESRLPLKTQKLDSKAARGGKDPGYRRFGTRVKFGFRFFMGQECPRYLKRWNLGAAFFVGQECPCYLKRRNLDPTGVPPRWTRASVIQAATCGWESFPLQAPQKQNARRKRAF